MDIFKDLSNFDKLNINPRWIWSNQALALIEKYPKSFCGRCKYGAARVTTGIDSGGKHTIHIKSYCKLYSMDVYDNAEKSSIGEIIEFCEDFDDSPDED